MPRTNYIDIMEKNHMEIPWHDYTNSDSNALIANADLIEKVVETTWLIPVYLNMQTHKMACLYDHYEDVTHIFVPRTL